MSLLRRITRRLGNTRVSLSLYYGAITPYQQPQISPPPHEPIPAPPLPSPSPAPRVGVWARCFAAPPPPSPPPTLRVMHPESLPESTFHEVADHTLHDILDAIEAYVEAHDDTGRADIEYSEGVLTVKLGPTRGTYVLNKQTPNRQIWMSSPISGPSRYDYMSDGSWVYVRDQANLKERVRTEIMSIFGGQPLEKI